MVEWILLHKHRLSDLLHYLDDFITAGPPQSFQCAYNLNTAISVCHRLGLPLHANKCVGPTTSMTILGIELDSVNQVARLPEDKLLAPTGTHSFVDASSLVQKAGIGVPYWPFTPCC